MAWRPPLPRLLLALAAVAAAVPAAAAPFQILGPRAMGMGGAHVAVAEGVAAAYWNPAAYGLARRRSLLGGAPVAPPLRPRARREAVELPPPSGLGVGGGVVGREYADILSAVNWFLDLADRWKRPSVSLVRATLADFRDGGRSEVRGRVRDLNVEGGGLETQAEARVVVRRGWWGIGYRKSFDLTAQAVAFDSHLGLEGLNRDALTVLFWQLPDRLATLSPYLTRNETRVPRVVGVVPGAVAAAHRKVVRTRLRAARNLGRRIPGLRSVVDRAWRSYDAVDTGLAIAAEANHPKGSFADNRSFVRWRGAKIDEVPLTVGLPLTGRLLLGANLKYMDATTYFQEIRVFERDDDLNLGEYDVGSTTDSDFGLDLGLLYLGRGWRAGVLARNVNSPSFDYPRLSGIDRGAFVLDPQVRAGVAWLPWRALLLAADLDLTRNHSTLPQVTSRILSGGLEYTPWSWLALRLGVIHDLEQDATGYAAGLGVHGDHLALDLAFAANVTHTHIHKDLVPKDFFLNDKSIPSDVAVDAALSYRF